MIHHEMTHLSDTGVSQPQGHNSFWGFPFTLLSYAGIKAEKSKEFGGLFIVNKYTSIASSVDFR